MKLKGNLITLRPLEKSDASALAKVANNKKIYDNVRDMFPHPYSLEDANQFIDFVQKATDTPRFAIEYQGEFAGMIGLHSQSDVYRKSLEIGYWLGEAFWGKGIATEAVKLIVDYGFKHHDINRIWAGLFEYNKATKRVLEKNGFEMEGVLKKAVFKNGEYWDEHRMGIVR